ncbi:hypothetical protein L596_021015 [Steinernema carpocapsae]|uniref:Uncharacterized protein n=1 Tax=Steinernema carpocapsae TaxID=34508 RepID=A0A4U5MV66_STECR|nr:hypothetical protein L596_021015 [Steinernema carpocapsae]
MRGESGSSIRVFYQARSDAVFFVEFSAFSGYFPCGEAATYTYGFAERLQQNEQPYFIFKTLKRWKMNSLSHRKNPDRASRSAVIRYHTVILHIKKKQIVNLEQHAT